MARRFSGARTRLVRSGRKTFWLSGTISESTLGAGNSALLVTALNAAALALRPFTIIRSRGYWSIQSDQVIASEDQIVHYGGIVVSDQAVATGVAAVPTPVTEDGSSWFFFDGITAFLAFHDATGINPQFATLRVVDSKAMRKVEEGQDVIEVIQNSAISQGVDVVTYMKYLIKLH